MPEVIDCWFDSGCMPFAQWGYPHQNEESSSSCFPADFITEAVDQTRGWFYSLHDDQHAAPTRSAALPHPYKQLRRRSGSFTDEKGLGR